MITSLKTKKGSSPGGKTLLRLALLCLLALIICSAGFAETENTPEPTLEPGVMYPNESEGIEVHSAQEKLAELGYLDPDETNYKVDWEMRYAMKRFCENNGVVFEDKGLTDTIWQRLMYDSDLISVTAPPSDPFIPFGEESDRVTAIQIRLKDLGYFEGKPMTLAVYDTAMHRAIEEFCRINNLICEDTGLSVALQEMINSDAAIPYFEEITFMQSLRTFLAGHVIAGNVRIPNMLWLAALYIAVYALVAGLIVFIFRIRASRRANRYDPEPVDIPTTDWVGSQNCHVDFQIIYRNKTRQQRCSVRGDFTIGRSGCSLNLDREDKAVSKKHCHLYFGDSMLRLKDVSKYGTYVNEILVQKNSIELHSGDQIQIGKHMLIVRY